MSRGHKFDKIEDKLAVGERVVITPEHMQLVDEAIPHVTLHTKLQQLKALGVIQTSPSKYLDGGSVYLYEGKKIRIVANYAGKSKWSVDGEVDFDFEGPHDLAIDTKSKRVIAYARS
jgi:hypothetical protein